MLNIIQKCRKNYCAILVREKKEPTRSAKNSNKLLNDEELCFVFSIEQEKQ